MFSPAQALRLEAPMPPMPIAARFSLLLGASCPSTRLGTMAADNAAIAAVDVNCLRETVRVESSLIRESSVGNGQPSAGNRATRCYREAHHAGTTPPHCCHRGRRPDRWAGSRADASARDSGAADGDPAGDDA